ncbi:MAG TPA: SGNH/GDSL hydrolase family protein [Acetobacteraceae bacterium]|nr:SGNH/GDSL hydrolase family protein [Acetobacteraceae bacterium]
MRVRNLIASVVAAASLALAPVTARAYSAFYLFGDSLSDAGNLYLATGTPASPPYYFGEFSNGPIWAQYLSVLGFGLGPVLPSLVGGNDYAWGGATTGYPATGSSPPPTLADQVGAYIAGLGPGSAPPTALYSVWIGANDIFTILKSGVTFPTAVQYAQGAAGAEAQEIQALALKGAKHFLVPLVPNLGVTPGITSEGPIVAAAATRLSQVYNATLRADLAPLVGAPGLRLSYLDVYALLDEVVADPGVFGFTNGTDACYVGPYTGGGSVCADPNDYVFWDQVHPTTAAGLIVAEAAFGAVPEPRALLVFATALAALAVTRRAPRAS